jgi:predicted Holliday junction resolvase-like endonuclease
MNVYILLFLLGFILAVCMLAYASIQVAELNKKAEEFSKSLKERYSKPIVGLDDKKEQEKAEKAEKEKEKLEKERAENEKKS